MDTGILKAVGRNAPNNDIDVETIQKLLNRTLPPFGPPTPRLAEDGDCGPLTIAAINQFQQRALGFSDGVIEPNRTTHKKLSDLSGPAIDVPSRVELADSLAPFVLPMVLQAITALSTLQRNPEAPGPGNDRTRLALKVHFLLDDGRDDHIGRVLHRFRGIRVHLETRKFEDPSSSSWRSVTMRQAKIELNQRISARVPAIYHDARSRASLVFTPNYKPLDAADGLGYGPQMLGYRLLTGVAKRTLGSDLNERDVESDTPGFPGPNFEAALENPPSYGSFAFHLRLGFAQPLGENMRRI